MRDREREREEREAEGEEAPYREPDVEPRIMPWAEGRL